MPAAAQTMLRRAKKRTATDVAGDEVAHPAQPRHPGKSSRGGTKRPPGRPVSNMRGSAASPKMRKGRPRMGNQKRRAAVTQRIHRVAPVPIALHQDRPNDLGGYWRRPARRPECPLGGALAPSTLRANPTRKNPAAEGPHHWWQRPRRRQTSAGRVSVSFGKLISLAGYERSHDGDCQVMRQIMQE